LASPADKQEVERCVATLTDKLQLPDVIAARLGVLPVSSVAALLTPAYLRHLTALSNVRGVSQSSVLQLVASHVADVVAKVMGVVGGSVPVSVEDLLEMELVHKTLVSNVIAAPDLSVEEKTQMLTSNSLLKSITAKQTLVSLGMLNALKPNAVSGLPTMPGVPSMPGLPSMPGVPSVPGLPSMPGVPSVPGLPSMPGVPSVPGLPSMPGVSSVPGLHNMPGVPSVPGLPSIPGVPSVPGLPQMNNLDLERYQKMVQLELVKRALGL